MHVLSHFGCVQVSVILWTVAHQAPLSTGFSRQEYWSGLPCHPSGDLPDPGIKPGSPVLAGWFSTTSTTWEAHLLNHWWERDPRSQIQHLQNCKEWWLRAWLSAGRLGSGSELCFLLVYHWSFSLLSCKMEVTAVCILRLCEVFSFKKILYVKICNSLRHMLSYQCMLIIVVLVLQFRRTVLCCKGSF